MKSYPQDNNLISPPFFWKSEDLRVCSLLCVSATRILSFLFFLFSRSSWTLFAFLPPLETSKMKFVNNKLIGHLRSRFLSRLLTVKKIAVTFSNEGKKSPMHRGESQIDPFSPFARHIDLCFRAKTLCPAVDNPINPYRLGPAIPRLWCN